MSEDVARDIVPPNQGSPRILAIDASGSQASVALWDNGTLLGQTLHHAKHGHAATLVPMAQELLLDHNISFNTLTHIAGGRGPGSFTGIRVALAAAKGFCLATNAAPVGISVLEANAYMAVSCGLTNACEMVVLADTRRGNLYAQLFDPFGAPQGDIIEAAPDDVLDSLSKRSTPIAIAGPLAAEVSATSKTSVTIMSDLPPPDAAQIAMLAAAHITSKTESDLLTPLYLAPAFLGPKRTM